MTPLPEVSPSADTLRGPLFTVRFSAVVVDAVTIALRFVRFFPSLAFLFSSFFLFLSIIVFPRRRNRAWPFLFPCLSHLPRPSQLSFFSLILRCVLVAATPVLPSLLACSSIPVPWDLARERLSSYIEKSSGREKNWRYLYHPLCFCPSPFYHSEAYRAEEPMYLTNCSRHISASSYNILQL